MTDSRPDRSAVPGQAVVVPLALAQFIASYAATNMNVAISTIAADIGTTVIGMQTTITLFTLTMASLMIPGSKLSGILGRKVCFVAGLAVYGAGALLASFAHGLGVMVIGYSVLEGVGSALMIPPIYILVTVVFKDVQSRAKNFGIVSGAAGLGAAAGPLLGGVITSVMGWRASFLLQVLVVVVILFLAFRIVDPGRRESLRTFDIVGAILSAAGLFFIVLGILWTGTYGWLTSRQDFSVGDTVLIPAGGISPVWLSIGIGALILVGFFVHIRAREKADKEPLLHLRLFADKTANLGLGTQNVQWLTMQGSFFVISVFLQQVRSYNAIQTGLALTPATIGILASAALAERFSKRHSQRWLIQIGFAVTAAGMMLLLVLARERVHILAFAPGLLLMGLGVGAMLTSSVNVVQSSFGEQDQDDISGLSRSVSNLGSSLGTALVGSVLVAASFPGGRPFALSLTLLVGITLIGLLIATLIPRERTGATEHGERAES